MEPRLAPAGYSHSGPCLLLAMGSWGAMVQAEMWCPVVNEP